MGQGRGGSEQPRSGQDCGRTWRHTGEEATAGTQRFRRYRCRLARQCGILRDVAGMGKSDSVDCWYQHRRRKRRGDCAICGDFLCGTRPASLGAACVAFWACLECAVRADGGRGLARVALGGIQRGPV